MADGMARSPSRLCSRDGKICCYGDALSSTFLLACFCALLPTFRFSFFFSFFYYYFSLHPGMFVVLRVPSSVPQSSATLSKYVFLYYALFLLASFAPYPISEFLCFFSRLPGSFFFFRSSYFSGCVFFVVLSYPVR